MGSPPVHPFSLSCGSLPCGRGASQFASARRTLDALSPKAKNSCGNVEYGIRRIRRQFALSDSVENDLPGRRLRSLNRVLLRVSVQQHVQFRHFSNPTAIDLAVKLDHELHSHTLPPLMRSEHLAGRLWSSPIWRLLANMTILNLRMYLARPHAPPAARP